MEICTLPIVPRNWVDPILRASAARNLLNQPHHVLFALGSKAEGGHILARLVPGTPADILTLFVREQHRRNGHAETLLNHLIQTARAESCIALTLEVRASNQPARKLYEKCGFHQVATRPAYYQSPAEDAVVYTRQLP